MPATTQSQHPQSSATAAAHPGAAASQFRSWLPGFLQDSYATIIDFDEISIAENSRGDFSESSKLMALGVAFGLVNGWLGQRWELPLKYWSKSIVWAQCEVAYSIVLPNKRGYKAGGDEDKLMEMRLKRVDKWLKDARDYDITPDPRLMLTEPALPATVTGDRPRGWHGGADVPAGLVTKMGRFFG
jgi:hypothetical protein